MALFASPFDVFDALHSHRGFWHPPAKRHRRAHPFSARHHPFYHLMLAGGDDIATADPADVFNPEVTETDHGFLVTPSSPASAPRTSPSRPNPPDAAATSSSFAPKRTRTSRLTSDSPPGDSSTPTTSPPRASTASSASSSPRSPPPRRSSPSPPTPWTPTTPTTPPPTTPP